MKILYFDIETSPCVGWFWRSGKQNVGAHQIINSGKIICIAYRFSNWKPGKVKSIAWSKDLDDKDMLTKFTDIAQSADIVIGHNGDGFDIRWLNARVAYHKLPRIHITASEDTYKMVKKTLYLPSYKLEYLCRYFEINRKLSTASGLWQRVCFDNDRKALADMVAYCENDVLVLSELDDRVRKYVDGKVNRSLFSGAGACPGCGGFNMEKHGFNVTRVGKYQRYRCKDCGKTFRGSHNLVQSGGYLR